MFQELKAMLRKTMPKHFKIKNDCRNANRFGERNNQKLWREYEKIVLNKHSINVQCTRRAFR